MSEPTPDELKEIVKDERVRGAVAEYKREAARMKVANDTFDFRYAINEKRHERYMVRLKITYVIVALEMVTLAYIAWRVTP